MTYMCTTYTHKRQFFVEESKFQGGQEFLVQDVFLSLFARVRIFGARCFLSRFARVTNAFFMSF